MLTVNSFPNLTELERISTLKKYQKLYDGEHFAVLGLHEMIKSQYVKEKDIIYLAHNLPAYISDFYGDFVAGDPEDMIIRGNTGNAEVDTFVDETVYENDLKEKVSDIGTQQSEFGYSVLLSYLNAQNIYRIVTVGQDQYFPQPDGSIIFATWKTITSTNGLSKTMYCLTQHYQLIGSDCVIERQAWECSENGVIKSSFDFSILASFVGQPDLKEREVLANLGDLPIRQIDNSQRSHYGFGKSDYADIIPQIAETNERATHIATQLLKNLDAKMQLPIGMFDEDGNVQKFESIGMEKGDVEAKYITNSNPLIAEAREHITQQIKTISLITAVPMFELLKSSMPERVESLRIQLFATARRTARKRAKITRALQDMFRIGFKMRGIAYDEDIEIEYSDVTPVDKLTQANVESIKVTSGLSSKRSAIMRLENVDIKDAEAELKQIQNEDQIAGIGQNPPTIEVPPVVPPKIDQNNA